jgi:phosphoribosylcarboxyaminoimidazole (NCAIR) mutase
MNHKPIPTGETTGEAEMEKVALVRVGYQEYALPLDALTAFLSAISGVTTRKVESEYRKGGYVYWYAPPSDGDEISVTVISAGRILESKPDPVTAVVTPVPVVATPPDSRVLAAPSDEPILIKSVPPMREFVDEWRHEEAA